MTATLSTAWMRPPKPHRLAPCCRSAIEGDRARQTLARAGSNAPPWDSELERNALGLALIGDLVVPAWLEPKHFFAEQHQRIFEAAREAKALHLAAARLRGIATSVELSALVDEAVHAVAMGWHFDWPRLVELANQRALLAAIERVAISLRAGDLTFAQAVDALAEAAG